MDRRTLEYILKVKDNASKGFQKVGKTAQSSFKRMKSAIFSVKTALVGVATYLIGRYVKSWLDAAAQQEDAIQKVLGMAKAQGAMFVGLREEVEKVTGALQRKTTYGDEAAMEAMGKMIATGAKTSDAMKELGLVMDMAAGTGMDLGTAGMYVARALMGQPEMLARYVPSIRNLAKEERDWATVKGILVKQFAGTAEQIAKTPFGKMKQIANLWGDIKERFGDFIALWLDKQQVFDAMKGIFEAVGAALMKTKKGAEEAAPPTKTLGLAMVDFASVMVTVGESVEAVIQTIKDNWKWIGKIAEASIKLIPIMKELIILWDWAKKQGDMEETAGTWGELREQIRLLRAQLDPYGPFDIIEEKALNAAGAVGENINRMMEFVDSWQESGQEIEYGKNRMGEFIETAEKETQSFTALKSAGSQMANTIVNEFWNMEGEASQAFKNIAKAFARMLSRMMAEFLATKAIMAIINLITGGAGSLISAQRGFSGYVEKPTMFLTHPGEHVQVTPATQPAPVNVIVHEAAPTTWVEVLANDVAAQDALYRNVTRPGQIRWEKK